MSKKSSVTLKNKTALSPSPKKIKKQLESCSAISVRLLSAASKQKECIGLSINNTAVYASNIQVAANAIVRLASDLGSINSIISSEDVGSELFLQAKKSYKLINKTAYHAEKTAKNAMQASVTIAENSSAAMADKAELANTSITDLIKHI